MRERPAGTRRGHKPQKRVFWGKTGSQEVPSSSAGGTCRVLGMSRVPNPASRVPHPKSRIPNPASRIHPCLRKRSPRALVGRCGSSGDPGISRRVWENPEQAPDFCHLPPQRPRDPRRKKIPREEGLDRGKILSQFSFPPIYFLFIILLPLFFYFLIFLHSVFSLIKSATLTFISLRKKRKEKNSKLNKKHPLRARKNGREFFFFYKNVP